MNIKCNMGTADRIVRLVIGLSLILFAVLGVFPGIWRVLLPIVGVVMVLTSAVAYCPLYPLIGLNGAKR